MFTLILMDVAHVIMHELVVLDFGGNLGLVSSCRHFSPDKAGSLMSSPAMLSLADKAIIDIRHVEIMKCGPIYIPLLLTYDLRKWERSWNNSFSCHFIFILTAANWWQSETENHVCPHEIHTQSDSFTGSLLVTSVICTMASVIWVNLAANASMHQPSIHAIKRLELGYHYQTHWGPFVNGNENYLYS